MATKPTKISQTLEKCLILSKDIENISAAIEHMVEHYNASPNETLEFYISPNYMDTYVAIGNITVHVETVQNPRKVQDKIVTRDDIITKITNKDGESVEGKLKNMLEFFNHAKLEISNQKDIEKLILLANYIHEARNADNGALRQFYFQEHKIV